MFTSARTAPGWNTFARSWPRWALSLLAVLSLLLFTRVAAAYTPPPIDGPVNDPKGQLTPAEKQALVTKILGIKAARGYEIAVFLPSSLEGNTIEDVGYDTARAWKLGAQGKDDGVLLVIATKERKIRIETGKGVGGALPDLAANRIIKEDIGPQLKANRVAAGVEAGVDAIDAELAKDATGAAPPAKKPAPPASAGGVVAVLVVLLVMGGVGVLFLYLIVRAVMSAVAAATRTDTRWATIAGPPARRGRPAPIPLGLPGRPTGPPVEVEATSVGAAATSVGAARAATTERNHHSRAAEARDPGPARHFLRLGSRCVARDRGPARARVWRQLRLTRCERILYLPG